MSLRDQRQQEFAGMFIEAGCRGILDLCPRFGKIRTAIHVFNELTPSRVLIAYPDLKIRDSWENDFRLVGGKPAEVVYTTHRSLEKHAGEKFDLVVIDEVHALSERQVLALINLSSINPRIMCLTGTLAKETEKYMRSALSLRVVARYPMSLAIQEGVISDYRIRVVTIPLDDKQVKQFGKKSRTEKNYYDAMTWSINKMEEEGKDTRFLKLNRMRVLATSISKRSATLKLINIHRENRLLVFCGTIDFADNLGIPSYHSKSTEKQVFKDFAEGNGNHLAVIKIGNAGVTYKPLNRIIMNYFDSNPENMAQKINRCMSMEYDNPDKIAYIDIVCTTEYVEQTWLRKALEFFDRSKITWVKMKPDTGLIELF